MKSTLSSGTFVIHATESAWCKRLTRAGEKGVDRVCIECRSVSARPAGTNQATGPAPEDEACFFGGNPRSGGNRNPEGAPGSGRAARMSGHVRCTRAKQKAVGRWAQGSSRSRVRGAGVSGSVVELAVPRDHSARRRRHTPLRMKGLDLLAIDGSTHAYFYVRAMQFYVRGHDRRRDPARRPREAGLLQGLSLTVRITRGEHTNFGIQPHDELAEALLRLSAFPRDLQIALSAVGRWLSRRARSRSDADERGGG